MNDISALETPYWQLIEKTAHEVLSMYGYAEVRPPMVEHTELFSRSVGEATDIVEKEMYTFEDRRGKSLSLRPECTASCVRAAVQHGWLREGGQRIWHTGPMFRYERPQKGRYRQFHQLDVEALGFAGPDVDAELILLSARLCRRLGLDRLVLQLNSLGNRDVQAAYRAELERYFRAHTDDLDEDSRRRLEKNPLRILDSKNPALADLIEAAPRMLDHLDDESRTHFETLRRMLDGCGIEYHVNPRLVRGLDYYTRTVFEWQTDELGAQNAVCGGGRYDNLIGDVGGQPAPAIGFAMGLERMVELLKAREAQPPNLGANVYLATTGTLASERAPAIAEKIRDNCRAARLVVDAGSGSFKSKLKRAARSSARFALLLGDDEARDATVSLKDLRTDAQQRTLSVPDLLSVLETELCTVQHTNAEPAI